jgi:hypothetical protein
MKRVVIIKQLIGEGFTDKFLSKLTDKQLKELSERVLSEQTLNIPKDDDQSIEKAKQEKKQFVTYEEDMEEASSPEQQAAIAVSMKKSGKKPKKEMNEWVEGVIKKNYHTNITTKKEIYEMIGSLSDSADKLMDSKKMFDVDEQQPSPSKPGTDTPVREKPTTRPDRPKRENPFEPKHTPKPKAKLPKELSFNSLGFDFKMAAE